MFCQTLSNLHQRSEHRATDANPMTFAQSLIIKVQHISELQAANNENQNKTQI